MTRADVHKCILVPVERFTKANLALKGVGCLACYLDHTLTPIAMEPANTCIRCHCCKGMLGPQI